MHRRGHKGRSVSALLASAALPGKCAWYFNNLAHRHSMLASRVSLLPSGTTSNEALRNELKQAFRQTVRLHQATPATKTEVFGLGKLLVHTLAAFGPRRARCHRRTSVRAHWRRMRSRRRRGGACASGAADRGPCERP